MKRRPRKETRPCNGEVDGEDDDPGGDDTVSAEAEAEAIVTHPANTSREVAGILLGGLPLCRSVPVSKMAHTLAADSNSAVFPPADAISCENGDFPLLLFRKLSPRPYRVRLVGHECDIGIGMAQLVCKRAKVPNLSNLCCDIWYIYVTKQDLGLQRLPHRRNDLKVLEISTSH